jgi:hypothetical protein
MTGPAAAGSPSRARVGNLASDEKRAEAFSQVGAAAFRTPDTALTGNRGELVEPVLAGTTNEFIGWHENELRFL